MPLLPQVLKLELRPRAAQLASLERSAGVGISMKRAIVVCAENDNRQIAVNLAKKDLPILIKSLMYISCIV